MLKKIVYLGFLSGLTLLTACGFHLRGSYSIPTCLKRLHIEPVQPMDPFQQMLRRVLMSHEVQILEPPSIEETGYSTLTISTQDFQEQALAYGMDGQLNRATLRLEIIYTLDIPALQKTTQERLLVSRELNVDPQNILSTENERYRLKNDLLMEAATQLALQLSLQAESPSPRL